LTRTRGGRERGFVEKDRERKNQKKKTQTGSS